MSERIQISTRHHWKNRTINIATPIGSISLSRAEAAELLAKLPAAIEEAEVLDFEKAIVKVKLDAEGDDRLDENGNSHIPPLVEQFKKASVAMEKLRNKLSEAYDAKN